MLLNCGIGKDSWESRELQEDQPVNPKGNQSWIFTGRTDAEVETPILRLPDAKNWLMGKDPDAGKEWRQEKGTTEVGWHHRLNGHEFEQALRDGEGEGSLACCRLGGHKELDTTECLNNNYINLTIDRLCTSTWKTKCHCRKIIQPGRLMPLKIVGVSFNWVFHATSHQSHAWAFVSINNCQLNLEDTRAL